MKILKQNLQLKACGKDTIARADDVFSYIDSDFENWNMDNKQPKTQETEMAVLEIDRDGTFKEIFGKPNLDKCLTQTQIIEFCKSHKDQLRDDGYANLFIFKEQSEFFVARVRLSSGGALEVSVYRFSRDCVWGAEYRHRIVVPQLALKYFEADPLTLSPSVSEAIEIVKKAGYVVYKQI